MCITQQLQSKKIYPLIFSDFVAPGVDVLHFFPDVDDVNGVVVCWLLTSHRGFRAGLIMGSCAVLKTCNNIYFKNQ